MSTTDKLLRLLDEFEHECYMIRVEASETRARDDVLRKAYEQQREKTAQAIAATLGNGECENVAPDYLDFLCSKCGFVHYHSDENDTGDGNDWNYCPRCGKAVKR